LLIQASNVDLTDMPVSTPITTPSRAQADGLRRLNRALQAAPLEPRQALAIFRAHGQPIASWASEQGFSVKLVYAVLSGRKCLRGESHRIALALHLKTLSEES
jgi:gp16 family phage-associated protein